MKSCCKEVMDTPPVNKNQNNSAFLKWLKRIGLAGFVFFLVKGLVWVAVFYGGLKLLGCNG